MPTTQLGHPIDQRTDALNLPLPHIDNFHEDDVPRLRAAFELLDTFLQLISLSLADKLDATSLTKAMVGLGNVDNTSDADKPISTQVQAAFEVLAQALADKQQRLESGENIKTVNGQSLLGAGGITVGDEAAAVVAGDWNTIPAVNRICVGADLANAPTAGRVVVAQIVDTDSGLIAQTAYPAADAFGRVFYRQKQGGTWRAWRQLAQQSEAIIDLAGGAIDCSKGSRFYEAVAANRTLTVTNIPAAGIDYGLQLEIALTAGVITHFANVIWPNGVAPSLAVNKRHLLYFSRSRDGTKWYGAYLQAYPL